MPWQFINILPQSASSLGVISFEATTAAAACGKLSHQTNEQMSNRCGRGKGRGRTSEDETDWDWRLINAKILIMMKKPCATTPMWNSKRTMDAHSQQSLKAEEAKRGMGASHWLEFNSIKWGTPVQREAAKCQRDKWQRENFIMQMRSEVRAVPLPTSSLPTDWIIDCVSLLGAST